MKNKLTFILIFISFLLQAQKINLRKSSPLPFDDPRYIGSDSEYHYLVSTTEKTYIIRLTKKDLIYYSKFELLKLDKFNKESRIVGLMACTDGLFIMTHTEGILVTKIYKYDLKKEVLLNTLEIDRSGEKWYTESFNLSMRAIMSGTFPHLKYWDLNFNEILDPDVTSGFYQDFYDLGVPRVSDYSSGKYRVKRDHNAQYNTPVVNSTVSGAEQIRATGSFTLTLRDKPDKDIPFFQSYIPAIQIETSIGSQLEREFKLDENKKIIDIDFETDILNSLWIIGKFAEKENTRIRYGTFVCRYDSALKKILLDPTYTYFIESKSAGEDLSTNPNYMFIFNCSRNSTSNKIIGTKSLIYLCQNREVLIKGLNWQYYARDIYLFSVDSTGHSKLLIIPFSQKTKNTYLFSYLLGIKNNMAILIFYEHKKNLENPGSKEIKTCELEPSSTVLSEIRINLSTNESAPKTKLYNCRDMAAMPRLFVWAPYFDGHINMDEKFTFGTDQGNSEKYFYSITFE